MLVKNRKIWGYRLEIVWRHPFELDNTEIVKRKYKTYHDAYMAGTQMCNARPAIATVHVVANQDHSLYKSVKGHRPKVIEKVILAKTHMSAGHWLMLTDDVKEQADLLVKELHKWHEGWSEKERKTSHMFQVTLNCCRAWVEGVVQQPSNNEMQKEYRMTKQFEFRVVLLALEKYFCAYSTITKEELVGMCYEHGYFDIHTFTVKDDEGRIVK